MGVQRLFFLKQLLQFLKQPNLHLPTKPHFNYSPFYFTPTRNFTQVSNDIGHSLHTKAIQFVANSPKTSLIPLLEQYEKDDVVKHNELKKIIHTFRSKKLFDRALELCNSLMPSWVIRKQYLCDINTKVSEWMTSRSCGRPISGDLAVRLDLTGQVHGIDAAENYFKEINDHSERMYGSLLSCYVKANLVDKSLSHFKMMKEKGLVTMPLAYNNIMTLYMKIGEVEKVLKLLTEMQENGITPDNVSFNLCLKSLAFKSDTTGIEKILNIMETAPRLSKDWSTYSLVANYFIGKGCKEKAMSYLEQTEHKVRGNSVGINHLITLYAKLGDKTRVMSLWDKHKSFCKAQINVDYITIIGSLVKMEEFEEAERIFREWELSGNLYDFRVPNALLLGYTRKGLVDKAIRKLDDIISNGKKPVPNTWSIISGGHIKCQNMDKASQCMMKALEMGSEHPGWVPNDETVSHILEWLGDNGEIEEVNKFLELLNRVIPMNQEMYRVLLRANIRHGIEVGDILQRMKADNIDVDEDTSKLIK